MDLARIKSQIKEGLVDEAETGRLASLVRRASRAHRLNMSERTIQNVVLFVQEYVSHVPYYMERAAAAAGRLGLRDQVEAMLDELATYWHLEDDVLPDDLGLVGLMDDAYASLTLLQSVSEYCSVSAGKPLLADNLRAANSAIRGLIGASCI